MSCYVGYVCNYVHWGHSRGGLHPFPSPPPRIFECLGSCNEAPTWSDFATRLSSFRSGDQSDRPSFHVSPMGAPCAPQKSPWATHRTQTRAFGNSQAPPLVVFRSPPTPICLMLKVRGAPKIGESSVHVINYPGDSRRILAAE